MNLLITGGSGSLGKALLRNQKLTEQFNKVVVFSRDEQKHVAMKKEFPEGGEAGIRYFLGDIRDKTRLMYALKGITHVIHAAALKHVDLAEYSPQEAIKTNVTGSLNVIEACIENGVKQCLMVSTDKAVSPANLYGSTKLCMEKLAIAANNLGACRFSVVRYGNVKSSKGSVIPLWKKQISAGEPVTITDKRMTRFWITLEEAAEFVRSKFDAMEGGEIFIPKLMSCTMTSLAMGIYIQETGLPQTPIGESFKEIGIRPGEKLHECLISPEEARLTYDQGEYYTIYPSHHDWRKEFPFKGKKVPEGFTYTSEC